MLAYYEEQTEEEAAAEDEAAFDKRGVTVMAAPKDLVAAVQELIAKHRDTNK
ncbi:hypothetical protein MCHI_002972 [Candidatus Magnetoovum chiemensis]|nr:hypothetical protein MCHI_002972 [Candidatus Magnetoovum chiemensis]